MTGHEVLLTTVGENRHDAICADCDFRVAGSVLETIHAMAALHREETRMDGLQNGKITAKRLGRLIIAWATALRKGSMSSEEVSGALNNIGNDLVSGRVVVVPEE